MDHSVKALPPGTPNWITLDLVQVTIDVYRAKLAIDLGMEDAVGVLITKGEFIEALHELEKDSSRKGDNQQNAMNAK